MQTIKKDKDLSKYHPGVNPEKIKLLEKHLKPGSILDVGCGNGLYSNAFQALCPEILQIDIQDRRDNKSQGLPFIKADIETLEFCELNKKYDNIIAYDIVEHLDDDARFIKLAHQLLKDGGKLFVSVPNEDNSLLERFNLAHIHFTDKTHRREYSREGVKALMQNNNFEVIEVVPHINRSVTNIPYALQRGNVASIYIAKFIKLQIRFFEKIGLFKNRIVADWFGVFEK